jgi:predicted transcriptional regulator
MGTARLNADAVRGLLEIFNRERAWQAMDELNAAAADAGLVVEMEEA